MPYFYVKSWNESAEEMWTNKISPKPCNSVKSSNESAEQMSRKQDLSDDIYFFQIPEVTIYRRNFEQTKIS